MLAASLLLVAAAPLAGCVGPDAPGTPDSPGSSDVVAAGPAPERVAPSPAAASSRLPFDRTAHSTTAPASLWVIVNKTHPLPASYRPDVGIVRGYQVARPVTGPLERLLEGAADDGVRFKIASAFRSYGYQRGVYRAQVSAVGRAAADRVSARPGYSEHQTGLAVDLITPDDPGCDFKACFGQRAGGRWVSKHAWEYGFVVRYPAAGEDVTGYQAEPWHVRYVGDALARELHENPATLEEFFDVPGGGYPRG
jgi:D-alanyl-D-alanine carboxypeptidase